MMTDRQYREHVKRIENAKKKGDKKKASELSQELWDTLSKEETPQRTREKKEMTQPEEKKESPFKVVQDEWMNDDEIGCEANCPLAGDCAPDCEGAFY